MADVDRRARRWPGRFSKLACPISRGIGTRPEFMAQRV
jgi:hypothetical protein